MIDQPKDADTFIRELRQRLHTRVAERFAKYGQPTLQIVQAAATRGDGLAQLIQRLGMAAPQNFDDQLSTLAVYLNEHGKNHFLHLAGAEPAQDHSATQPAAPPKPERLFDDQGHYIGPERRSGAERRSGVDRRANLETIWKNKRFGGDRRKEIRRQCDRELAARLGLRPNKFPPQKPKPK